MTASNAPTPSPEHDDNELPLAPPPPKGGAEQPPPTESDPLAKWRAARELEEDMADIFDEDRVTHKHGGAEPEAD